MPEDRNRAIAPTRRFTLAGMVAFASWALFGRRLLNASRLGDGAKQLVCGMNQEGRGRETTDEAESKRRKSVQSGASKAEVDPLAYVIAQPCIGRKETTCLDACPVDCIGPKKDDPHFSDTKMLFIDPEECIQCGACVPVCPVSAIFAVADLPEKWEEYIEKNRKYFHPD